MDLITTTNFNIILEKLNNNYRQDVKLFLEWLTEPLILNEPKAFLNDVIGKINQYIGYCLDQNKKVKTINRYKVSLKAFTLKAFGNDSHTDEVLKSYIDKRFKQEIKKLKADRNTRSYLTRFEVDKLINEADKRTSLILKFFFQTGLRCSEVCNILIENCKPDGNFKKIRVIGKGYKERFCYIPEDLFNEIVDTFNSKKYLFETKDRVKREGQIKTDKRYYRQNIYEIIKNAGKKILNKDIHPHTLRHSSASYLLNDRNISIYKVKEFLAHESIKTTEIYLHGTIKPNDFYDVTGAFI